VFRVADHDEDRVLEVPALAIEDLSDGGLVARIGSQAVEGLRREGDDAAAFQYRNGLVDPLRFGILRVDLDDHGHGKWRMATG